ncbi:MAG: YcbK family protein [Pseudomonadales bacterium]|nr:YcbK family protein [Pseudomonadales bacterium]
MPFSSTTPPSSLPKGRRGFLKTLAVAGLMGSAGARALVVSEGARELGFLNLHTGERLRVPYWENGNYVVDALAEINHVLRDHRANEEHSIDTALLDLLSRLQGAVGNSRSFEVISGYRAPGSNEMLRARSNGVAQGSMHLYGKAIDIRLPGSDLVKLHSAARALGGGGVGLYSSSNFIHVDTGRVRYW